MPRITMLAVAALAAASLAGSASAQSLSGSPAPGTGGVRIHSGFGDPGRPGRGPIDLGPRGARGTVYVNSFGAPEGWALYNNRSFAPDSYNGWWHDRPDRSMPRWMSQNENCERRWWSGGGWRC